MAEHKFPTEVIDLPSQGKVYPKDSPLSDGKIELKYMTTKEEDILMSQNLIKKGVVIDKLIKVHSIKPKAWVNIAGRTNYDLSEVYRQSFAPILHEMAVQAGNKRHMAPEDIAIYKKEELSSSFVFNNPNETERCGCGESFKIS